MFVFRIYFELRFKNILMYIMNQLSILFNMIMSNKNSYHKLETRMFLCLRQNTKFILKLMLTF